MFNQFAERKYIPYVSIAVRTEDDPSMKYFKIGLGEVLQDINDFYMEKQGIDLNMGFVFLPNEKDSGMIDCFIYHNEDYKFDVPLQTIFCSIFPDIVGGFIARRDEFPEKNFQRRKFLQSR